MQTAEQIVDKFKAKGGLYIPTVEQVNEIRRQWGIEGLKAIEISRLMRLPVSTVYACVRYIPRGKAPVQGDIRELRPNRPPTEEEKFFEMIRGAYLKGFLLGTSLRALEIKLDSLHQRSMKRDVTITEKEASWMLDVVRSIQEMLNR